MGRQGRCRQWLRQPRWLRWNQQHQWLQWLRQGLRDRWGPGGVYQVWYNINTSKALTDGARLLVNGEPREVFFALRVENVAQAQLLGGDGSDDFVKTPLAAQRRIILGKCGNGEPREVSAAGGITTLPLSRLSNEVLLRLDDNDAAFTVNLVLSGLTVMLLAFT